MKKPVSLRPNLLMASSVNDLKYH